MVTHKKEDFKTLREYREYRDKENKRKKIARDSGREYGLPGSSKRIAYNKKEVQRRKKIRPKINEAEVQRRKKQKKETFSKYSPKKKTVLNFFK